MPRSRRQRSPRPHALLGSGPHSWHAWPACCIAGSAGGVIFSAKACLPEVVVDGITFVLGPNCWQWEMTWIFISRFACVSKSRHSVMRVRYATSMKCITRWSIGCSADVAFGGKCASSVSSSNRCCVRDKQLSRKR